MKGAGDTDNDDHPPSSPPPQAATLEEHGLRNAEDAVEDEALELYGKDGDDEEPGGDIECQPSDSKVHGEGDEGRPKLADGYYEIEAVRRKRIRKGKAQYLIKWRDWAESANTWEPVANLRHCSDVIDAFEESLKSGQILPTRKRKRKTGVIRVQKKRKQSYNPQRLSPSAATYSIPSYVVRIIEEPARSFEMSEKMTKNDGTTTTAGFVVTLDKVEKDRNELDLTLCELARDSRLRRRDEVGRTVRSGPCNGAKKRKSGPAKRFKKNGALSSVDDGFVGLPPIRIKHRDFGDSCRRALEDSKSLWNITEIIQPINYRASTSDGRQEVFLAFEALRSDGTKVIVDNKILKANNPLLLIDFYEKHLTYTPK